MKIPETYEEYLKTPKSELVRIIESHDLTISDAQTLLKFNRQVMQERKLLKESENIHSNKETLWEELRGTI